MPNLRRKIRRTTFFPSPGRISMLRVPSGPGIRNDSGVYAGWNVPLEYDPLLSKLVAWAPSRDEAIARMRRALDEYQIGGIKDNVSFFKDVLNHPQFVAGDFDTGFIDRWLLGTAGGETEAVSEVEEDFAILVAAVFHSRRQRVGANGSSAPRTSEWKLAGRRDQLRKSRP